MFENCEITDTVCHNLVRTVATSCIHFHNLKFSLNNRFFKYLLDCSDVKIEFITKLRGALKLNYSIFG